jgi:hypothetical protein
MEKKGGYLFRTDPSKVTGVPGPGVLTYAKARSILREVGKAAGWLDSECFLHSLRIGLASCEAAAGLSLEEIKTLGRWKAESSVAAYVRKYSEDRNKLVERALTVQMSWVLPAYEMNCNKVQDEMKDEPDSDAEAEELLAHHRVVEEEEKELDEDEEEKKDVMDQD